MERYAKNAGAVFSLKYHIVWCPRYRRPVLLKPKPVDRRLKSLLKEKSQELGITIHTLEVMSDRVHLFLEPTLCLAEIVNRLNGYASHQIKRDVNHRYVCFSVERESIALPDSLAEMVGIDVGLDKFAVLSDGTEIENPRQLAR